MVDLLALVYVVYVVYCFCYFPIGILGQVWYLIVSIPDPCCRSYFVILSLQQFEFDENLWGFSMSAYNTQHVNGYYSGGSREGL